MAIPRAALLSGDNAGMASFAVVWNGTIAGVLALRAQPVSRCHSHQVHTSLRKCCRAALQAMASSAVLWSGSVAGTL